nr:hypothetical protein [Natronosalvus caseinilyticus]
MNAPNRTASKRNSFGVEAGDEDGQAVVVQREADEEYEPDDGIEKRRSRPGERDEVGERHRREADEVEGDSLRPKDCRDRDRVGRVGLDCVELGQPVVGREGRQAEHAPEERAERGFDPDAVSNDPDEHDDEAKEDSHRHERLPDAAARARQVEQRLRDEGVASGQGLERTKALAVRPHRARVRGVVDSHGECGGHDEHGDEGDS